MFHAHLLPSPPHFQHLPFYASNKVFDIYPVYLSATKKVFFKK